MAELLDVMLALAAPGTGRNAPIHPRGIDSSRYRPHFRTDGSDLLGVEFVDGPAILRPGEEAECTVKLLYTDTGVDYSPLVDGAQFVLVEGPHLVGSGRVLRRYKSDQKPA